jgi:hypothetical protein
MVERGLSPETWQLSQEVQDVLNASSKVFGRQGIPVVPVSFAPLGKMSEAEAEEMIRTHAIYADFKARNLPAELLDPQVPVSIRIQSAQGTRIILSADYFRSEFSDKSDPERLSAYSIHAFSTICHSTLQNAAREVLITDDPKHVKYFSREVLTLVRNMGVEIAEPGIVEYAQELEQKLDQNTNLKIVAKGQRIMLKDENLIYFHEFADADVYALQIIEQHLRQFFIREMKKTPWFVPPEKWRLTYRDIYKKTITPAPKDIGPVEQFLQDYLNSKLAEKVFWETRELEAAMEAAEIVEAETEITHAPKQQPVTDKTQETVPIEVQSKKPKKKKERKAKLYPNQKAKLQKQAAEDLIISDALAIVRSLLTNDIPTVDEELVSGIMKRLEAGNKRKNKNK